MSLEAFLNKRVSDLETEIVVLKQEIKDKDKQLSSRHGTSAERISSLTQCLIWIRENAVHGNGKFVDKINETLGGL